MSQNDLFNSPSGDDPRFKFSVGDKVRVIKDTLLPSGNKKGDIAIIKSRCNGYPPPLFTDWWYPLYYLEHIDGSGGGDIHENCLELVQE